MLPAELNTPNLRLRPFAASDGPAVYAYWKSDPGWAQFNDSVPADFTLRDAADFVAEMIRRSRLEQPNWALMSDDVLSGVVSLSFEPGHRVATIGYGIHADLRGRGLCVEAVGKVLGCAFSAHTALREVHARTDGRNAASIRVLEKLGFEAVATSEATSMGFCGLTYRLGRVR